MYGASPSCLAACCSTAFFGGTTLGTGGLFGAAAVPVGVVAGVVLAAPAVDGGGVPGLAGGGDEDEDEMNLEERLDIHDPLRAVGPPPFKCDVLSADPDRVIPGRVCAGGVFGELSVAAGVAGSLFSLCSTPPPFVVAVGTGVPPFVLCGAGSRGAGWTLVRLLLDLSALETTKKVSYRAVPNPRKPSFKQRSSVLRPERSPWRI